MALSALPVCGALGFSANAAKEAAVVAVIVAAAAAQQRKIAQPAKITKAAVAANENPN